MIGLYTLGAAHGAPGFDVGAENMPRRPIEGPGRHKADTADIGDYGGTAHNVCNSASKGGSLLQSIYPNKVIQ